MVGFSFMPGRWQEALELGHGGGILERAFVAKDHPRIKTYQDIIPDIFKYVDDICLWLG